MYKRILVAVDGSHTAEIALHQAIELASLFKAKLRIVHAIDFVNLTLVGGFINPPELEAAMSNNGREVLRKAAAIAGNAGIEVETGLIEIHTLGRRLPEAIAADSDEWSADLIVICSHGRHGVSRLFMGSVAEGIMRATTKPVLLIRGK